MHEWKDAYCLGTRQVRASHPFLLRLVPLFPLVPSTPAVHPDQPTGASLTQMAFFASHPHGLSFRPRAYHFFGSTTLSASISSTLLGHDLLQPCILVLRRRIRRISLISMPAYLVFHL